MTRLNGITPFVQGRGDAPSPVAQRRTERPAWQKLGCVAGIVALGIFGIVALIWAHFRVGSTVHNPEARGVAEQRRVPGAATNGVFKTSGDFTVEDLDPDTSTAETPVGPTLVPRLESQRRPGFYHSLPTGTRLMEETGTAGNGVLGVQNGTPEDAVVRLYDQSSEATIRWFYVKAHESARIRGIPEGIYGLRYTTGLDWQDGDDAFRWQPAYSQFERQFVYAEQWVGAALHYKEIRITLQPVIGGTVRTISISREDFLRGHRHASVQR